jgi:hypothetical protein
MWLDTVVIDKIGANGTLQTLQLRPERREDPLVADLLENIDPSFRDASVIEDIGPLRVYDNGKFKVNRLSSLIKNIAMTPSGDLFIQYDHFHIPVFQGYFAVIFPRGWRIKKIKIYDPYDDTTENLLDKRNYKDIDVCYSSQSRTSFAQLNMRTTQRRPFFSLGITAELAKIETPSTFMERVCDNVEIRFTDPRHSRGFENFLASSNQLAKETESSNIPTTTVGMSGPFPTVQTDLFGWLRFLRQKIRPAPR